MPIWEHSSINTQPPFEVFELCCRQQCIYCHTELVSCDPGWSSRHEVNVRDSVQVCPACGWWIAERELTGNIFEPVPEKMGGFGTKLFGSVGTLKQLDLTDISIPLNEVRSFLIARYDARFTVHPRVMEQTVASVFADLGYRTVVTGYSRDEGIDVILNRGNDGAIGVQVKRYKGRIKVEQIRSLAGALLLGGYTAGVFVTTSGFQSGVDKTAKRFRRRGLPIELIDAEQFYDALKIAQLSSYDQRSRSERPFAREPVELIAEKYGPCGSSTRWNPVGQHS